MAAVSFRIGEGSRVTPNRTVQSVGASGLVVLNAALTTPTIGDTFEISVGGISGNVGFYTIYGLSGTLGYYVRPFPNLQSVAGGQANRLNRTGAIATSGTAISGIQALSGAGNLAVVWVPGASLRSSGVSRNDRAVISGSSVSGNWGAWFVQDVISEDMAVLRPPDRGAGLATESPGTGSIVFRQGCHVAKIVPVSGETLGWATLAASGILPVSGASLYQGSGELRDYVRAKRINGAGYERDVYTVEGLTGLTIAASGLTDISWLSRNEIVVSLRPDPTAGGGSLTGDNAVFNITSVSGAPAEPIDLQLGANPATDRYSAASGSVWHGFRFGNINPQLALFRTNLWGSYIDLPAAGQIVVSPNASGVASIFRDNLTTASGSLIESSIVYGSAFNPTGDADSKNLLVASTSSTANISNAGAVIGGLLISEATFSPIAGTIFTSGDPALLLDPRTDLDLPTYFFIFLAGGSMEKRYTFNPRFVSLDAPASNPAAISGLYVEIYEVVESTGAQTLVVSGLTDGNGYLNAGAGHQLRRQRIDGANVLTEYSHRLVAQGGGFRLENRLFSLAARVDADVTVQRIAPDYESEFDE